MSVAFNDEGAGVRLEMTSAEPLPAWMPRNWEADVAKKIVDLGSEVGCTIVGATNLGWRVATEVGQPSVTIISPDGKHRHHFAPGRKVRTKRIREDITKHADPEKLEALVNDVDRSVEEILYGKSDVEVEILRPVEPKPRAIPRHVVEVKKMLASAGKAGGYESEIALERLWSDGTTDYKCVKCDHTSEKRLSIRSHWRKHINAGEVEAGIERDVVKGVEVPNAASYAPRAARVEALAEVLAGLLAGGDCGPEDIAKLALTWVHEQSRKGTRLSAEAEELEPEDMLQRIRTLLLSHDPATAQRMAEVEELRTQQAGLQAEILRLQQGLAAQQQELTTAQQQLTTVQSERDRFEARAARAAGDLRAFRDLLASTVVDDEGDDHDQG